MQLQAYRLSLFFCTRRRYRRVNGVAEREKKGTGTPDPPGLLGPRRVLLASKYVVDAGV